MDESKFFFFSSSSKSLIDFPNTGPFSSLKWADELDISFFSRGGMSWHLYTPVGPLKNHPTGAFYSSNGSSRHQSLKDKCASSLALTPGICRRFFLHHPPRRFIILSKFHHFILRDARFLGSFSLLLPTLGMKFILVDPFSRNYYRVRGQMCKSSERNKRRKRGSISIEIFQKLHDQERPRTNRTGTKNRKICFYIITYNSEIIWKKKKKERKVNFPYKFYVKSKTQRCFTQQEQNNPFTLTVYLSRASIDRQLSNDN